MEPESLEALERLYIELMCQYRQEQQRDEETDIASLAELLHQKCGPMNPIEYRHQEVSLKRRDSKAKRMSRARGES
jgi:hypothetical protein